ncbi:hypothetical protein CERSUDRAFT_84965 [Gelatoporia subvermispora B]|uniref:Uncharacterized protein n=1 Tax=Ceriporiopsis subvermispora (strain B) TaxID=914234 RepID=M2QFP8_CERS8|nr:hypothetical protein CERSUDRAFT_84965 [Gelatoporia subvermispora B]
MQVSAVRAHQESRYVTTSATHGRQRRRGVEQALYTPRPRGAGEIHGGGKTICCATLFVRGPQIYISTVFRRCVVRELLGTAVGAAPLAPDGLHSEVEVLPLWDQGTSCVRVGANPMGAAVRENGGKGAAGRERHVG